MSVLPSLWIEGMRGFFDTIYPDEKGAQVVEKNEGELTRYYVQGRGISLLNYTSTTPNIIIQIICLPNAHAEAMPDPKRMERVATAVYDLFEDCKDEGCFGFFWVAFNLEKFDKHDIVRIAPPSLLKYNYFAAAPNGTATGSAFSLYGKEIAFWQWIHSSSAPTWINQFVISHARDGRTILDLIVQDVFATVLGETDFSAPPPPHPSLDEYFEKLDYVKKHKESFKASYLRAFQDAEVALIGMKRGAEKANLEQHKDKMQLLLLAEATALLKGEEPPEGDTIEERIEWAEAVRGSTKSLEAKQILDSMLLIYRSIT